MSTTSCSTAAVGGVGSVPERDDCTPSSLVRLTFDSGWPKQSSRQRFIVNVSYVERFHNRRPRPIRNEDKRLIALDRPTKTLLITCAYYQCHWSSAHGACSTTKIIPPSGVTDNIDLISAHPRYLVSPTSQRHRIGRLPLFISIV